MKNKLLWIRIVFIIIVIILSILAFTGIGNRRIMMSYMLLVLGILQVFNGLYFCNIKRKGYGIFLIFTGVFLGAVAVRFLML